MKKWEKYQMRSIFTSVWWCGWTLWDGSSSLLTSLDGTSTNLICMSLLKWVVSCLKKIKYATKFNVQPTRNSKNEKKIKNIENLH